MANDTFYAVCAAVIPVLFLAVTLQGDFVINTLITSWRLHCAARRNATSGIKDLRREWRRVPLGYVQHLASLVVGVIAMLILIDALQGEVLSLVALASHPTSPGDKANVLQAALVLVVAVTLAFLVQWIAAIAPHIKANPASNPRDPSETPPSTSSPEPTTAS